MSACNSIILTLWFWIVFERAVFTPFVITINVKATFSQHAYQQKYDFTPPEIGDRQLQSCFVK